MREPTPAAFVLSVRSPRSVHTIAADTAAEALAKLDLMTSAGADVLVFRQDGKAPNRAELARLAEAERRGD